MPAESVTSSVSSPSSGNGGQKWFIGISVILLAGLLILIIVYACLSTPSSSGPSECFQTKQTAVIDPSAANTDSVRGFIMGDNALVVKTQQGDIVYDLPSFQFLGTKGGCPPQNVEPTLNIQAQYLYRTGLFWVQEHTVVQVRGFDLGNITLIRSKTGWIMVDTLTSTETCLAALQFAESQLLRLGEIQTTPLAIQAVVITHSHIDHFGGIDAIFKYNPRLLQNPPQVIGPLHLLRESISENVFGHNLLRRRASYMYGQILDHSCTSLVCTGLGLTVATGGTFSVASPTLEIDHTDIRPYTIDGIQCDFWYTPDAEAPSELMMYVPTYRLLMASEILVHSMHNLYSPRGTKIRSGYVWASYIDLALATYGPTIDIICASHHWPMWGNTNVVPFMQNQRDMYRYIHDQTLHWSDRGYTPLQIANHIELPSNLAEKMYNQPFYGALKMNIRATYAYYFGIFDGNPANLDPLPENEEAERFVQLLGGPDQLLKTCQSIWKPTLSIKDLRWLVTLLNKLVIYEPQNKAARDLLAQCYERLGTSTQENAIWRNFYLSGAKELRNGIQSIPLSKPSVSSYQKYTMADIILFLSIQIDPRLLTTNKRYLFEFIITEGIGQPPEKAFVELSNGLLFYRKHASPRQCVDTIIHVVSKIVLFALTQGDATYQKLVKSKLLRIQGNETAFQELVHAFSIAQCAFPLVSLSSSWTSNDCEMTQNLQSLLKRDVWTVQDIEPLLPNFSFSQC